MIAHTSDVKRREGLGVQGKISPLDYESGQIKHCCKHEWANGAELHNRLNRYYAANEVCLSQQTMPDQTQGSLFDDWICWLPGPRQREPHDSWGTHSGAPIHE
jgi:hypothetical protein